MTITEIVTKVLLTFMIAGFVAFCGMVIPASPAFVAPLAVFLAAGCAYLAVQVWS